MKSNLCNCRIFELVPWFFSAAFLKLSGWQRDVAFAPPEAISSSSGGGDTHRSERKRGRTSYVSRLVLCIFQNLFSRGAAKGVYFRTGRSMNPHWLQSSDFRSRKRQTAENWTHFFIKALKKVCQNTIFFTNIITKWWKWKSYLMSVVINYHFYRSPL